jgi:hypothetical protein
MGGLCGVSNKQDSVEEVVRPRVVRNAPHNNSSSRNNVIYKKFN